MGELGGAVCHVMCCLYLLAQTRAALTADKRHTAPRDTFRSVAQPGPWSCKGDGSWGFQGGFRLTVAKVGKVGL